MQRESQQLGLWLYRQATRFGLLSSKPARRLFNRAYFAYKRRVEDPFHALTQLHPEFFKGGHVIDVGANMGYTASVFAAAVKPPFRVWAFEPGSENFLRLQATIADNRLQPRVTAIRSAVGEAIGSSTLALNEFHPGDHQISEGNAKRIDGARLERVELTTVDEAVRVRAIFPVAFIKVDVQGYELQVCRGMARTLEENPSAIVVVEYSPASLRGYGVEPRELTRFFGDRGYGGYRLTHRGMLEPIDSTNPPQELPGSGYMDVLFARKLRGVSA
jgi:FkbM family methyltransferase